MYEISKVFLFEAGHFIGTLPSTHQCRRNHGHSYSVEVFFKSRTLNEHGFVIDYGKLEPFKNYVDSKFDHRVLNEVLAGERLYATPLASPFDLGVSTTAELLAHYLFDVAKALWSETYKVSLKETGKTQATYYQDEE